MECAVESEVLSDVKSLQHESFVEEGRHIFEKMKECTDALVDQEMPLQFQETTLIKGDSFLPESPKPCAANSPISMSNNVRSYSLTGGFEATSLTLPPPTKPLTVTNFPKLHSRKSQRENSSGHSNLMIKEASASPVFLDDTCAADNLQGSLNQTLTMEAAEIGSFNIFKDSVREELHTFFGMNESLDKHPTKSNMNSLKPAYHHASSTRGSFMLIKKNTELQGAEVSELDAHQTTGYTR